MEVMTNPDSKKQQFKGPHGGIVSCYRKVIDGSELHIVAEVFKDECYLITGFWT